MRITRLYLRNYRVYEEPMELEVPPGLLGVFGPNGAGKSTLLEGILFALWGKARTSKDGIRTSGVNADCTAELEFEHEGHLYLVRRSITGQNHTVRAQAHADGAQMAEGVRDVATYVHSVLGMDDVAFRASVFAEQKQLAAFSSHTPADRRKLVMQLLGITPLDTARDQARRDARDAAEQLARLRTLLPDRAVIREELDSARAKADTAREEAARSEQEADRAREARDAADAAHRGLVEVGREYERLVNEGKAVRAQRDAAAARVEALRVELGQLAGAEARLRDLSAAAEGLTAAEERLRLNEALGAAERALAQEPEPAPVTAPEGDIEAAEQQRAQAEAERSRLAELDGRLGAARAVGVPAAPPPDRSESLSGEEDCPVCGRALDAAFEQVQRHRAAELTAAEGAVAALETDRSAAAEAADAAGEGARRAEAAANRSRAAWAQYEKSMERRGVALAGRDAAMAALAAAREEPAPVDELAAAVRAAREAADECQLLRGRLQRRETAEAELTGEGDRLAGLESELDNLRDKVKALAFEPARLHEAGALLEAARAAAETRAAECQRSSALAAAADATVAERTRRLADAEEQHARLGQVEEEARHLARLAELLGGFRNTVVASVGPRLSAQAADLFAELTDGEYDQLKVDPDTYEIQIMDRGVTYGMDRFSGSETDLANLALRVAISEQVRFQSGGAVGLLVLDEVFGPLDEDRKARMLLALERLRGRFRQVLVVTHDQAMKEQMPAAVEVVKLPGRRATARVL